MIIDMSKYDMGERLARNHLVSCDAAVSAGPESILPERQRFCCCQTDQCF